MFIGPCTIVIVEEWKTNLMSLAILFHFFCAQHVLDINISIIRSLRLCWWITTSVVLFCKDRWFSVCIILRCMVGCVWCDVFCRFVVVGRCILIDFDRYLLCFVTTVFVCAWHFSLVVWYSVPWHHCVRLCVVFFIGCLVFSALAPLCSFVCGIFHWLFGIYNQWKIPHTNEHNGHKA